MILAAAHWAAECFCAAVLASVLLFFAARLITRRRTYVPRHVDLKACRGTVERVETRRLHLAAALAIGEYGPTPFQSADLYRHARLLAEGEQR